MFQCNMFLSATENHNENIIMACFGHDTFVFVIIRLSKNYLDLDLSANIYQLSNIKNCRIGQNSISCIPTIIPP